jgi:hypothetical protein
MPENPAAFRLGVTEEYHRALGELINGNRDVYESISPSARRDELRLSKRNSPDQPEVNRSVVSPPAAILKVPARVSGVRVKPGSPLSPQDELRGRRSTTSELYPARFLAGQGAGPHYAGREAIPGARVTPSRRIRAGSRPGSSIAAFRNEPHWVAEQVEALRDHTGRRPPDDEDAVVGSEVLRAPPLVR